MSNWVERDLAHVWHPCSQMKDYEQFLPQRIVAARGSHFYLEDNKPVIDAVSSWWCKHLGHCHPRLQAALTQQLSRYEQVILANTVQDPVVECAERVAALTGGQLDKVFFSGDGSCAVEVALKMSLQARYIAGETQRHRFLTLANGYHGETMATMAVSDCGLYKQPFAAHLSESIVISDVPYVSGVDDPLWSDAAKQWQQVEAQLTAQADSITAVIFEPTLQGAGGMKIYSADFLRRLVTWAKAQGIHVIADEIMTGFGRTGRMLACEWADVLPDIMCLGKGLTGGMLPLSATVTSTAFYQQFYDDYESGKAFMHSHTHSGNALAAAVAVEALTILTSQEMQAQITANSRLMQRLLMELAEQYDVITRVRAIGCMVAFDLDVDPGQRMGYQLFQQAVQEGAWLRPLGNTIYWLPPLNTDEKTLVELQRITSVCLQKIALANLSELG